MSDPVGGGASGQRYTTPLPPASVDITELRRTVDAAVASASGRQQVRTTVFETVGLLIIVAAVFAATAAADIRIAIAVSGVVLLIGVALIFVLPVQRGRRRVRATLDGVTATIDSAADRVVQHLASLGYAVPSEVALDWVTSPEPTTTVPLVHDSAIAARWWRPAEGDDRVFVEAFLRQDGQDSALPVLPPLQR